MTLFETLSSVKDPRRAAGTRTPLVELLIMSILAYMFGSVGYRGVSRFCKAYEETLKDVLKLKHAIPSHVTFGEVLNRINKDEFIAAFNAWIKLPIDTDKQLWINGDGNALRSTVINGNTSSQDFEAIVSFYSNKAGVIDSIASYNKLVLLLLFPFSTLKAHGITLNHLYTSFLVVVRMFSIV